MRHIMAAAPKKSGFRQRVWRAPPKNACYIIRRDGGISNLYGPKDAGQTWLDEYIDKLVASVSNSQ
jgi:hypothetical protein